MIALLLAAVLFQAPALNGVVVDSTGAPVRGAVVTLTVKGTATTVTTNEAGSWTVAMPNAADAMSLRISAPGFVVVERTINPPATALRTELRPEGIAEQITVSAETAPARLAIESSVTTIDRSTIAGTGEARSATAARRRASCCRCAPGLSRPTGT